MLRVSSSAFGLLVLLAASGCQDEAKRLGSPTHELPRGSAAYRVAPCWFPPPFPATTECGFVTVPLESGSPETIEVAIARFAAPIRDVEADPLVLLTGGPGQDGATLAAKSWTALAAMAGPRDIVAIDQRGTGASLPSLACPETSSAITEAEYLAAVTACRERLVDEGVALSAFRSDTNADDVEAVRAAFGYPAWNLLGVSYGSRLALTVIRDHGDSVRSAVLSSVVPLDVDLLGDVPRNAQRAFDRIFDGCAAQPACATAYPQLESDFRATVGALDANPATIEVLGTEVEFDGRTFVSVNFQLLYDASALAYVPGLLAKASRGDLTPYAKVLESLWSSGSSSYGMHLSLQCSEEHPFVDLDAAAVGGDPLYLASLGPDRYETDCAIWDVPPRGIVENQPVTSGLPVLLISGGFDPITPPSYADRVASSLSNATSFVFEGASHSPGLGDACGRRLVADFLEHLASSPSASACVSQSRVPTFL